MLTTRIPFLFLAGLAAWSRTPLPPPSRELEPPRLTIFVDPGHGGDDTGARGVRGLKEKQVVLDLALALAEHLREARFEVVLSRDEDAFIPVWDRARLANEAGADVFVSLHLNAHRTRFARGSEVYFLSLAAGDADAEEIAALENAGASLPLTPESVVASILDDLAQKAYLQDSEKLAVAIQEQLNRLGGIRERGVKQAPFAVLRGAAMPAVLVETVFLSNPKEEAKLRDPAFHRRVAEAITRGIQRFLAEGGLTTRRKAPGAGAAGTGTSPKQPS